MLILAVIDTNILVSAFRKPEGDETAVLAMVWSRTSRPTVPPVILAEYREVLLRPRFNDPIPRVTSVLDQLKRESLVLTPAAVKLTSPDPDDTKFIACAVAARARYLVTGNRRHFLDAAYGTAEVVNARQLPGRLAALA